MADLLLKANALKTYLEFVDLAELHGASPSTSLTCASSMCVRPLPTSTRWSPSRRCTQEDVMMGDIKETAIPQMDASEDGVNQCHFFLFSVRESHGAA